MSHDYTTDEMMTVVAARQLRDGQVVFVGIGLPSEAANLARLTHAPNAVLIYESGTIGTRPEVLPLSIGDPELAETADMVVSVPEIFAYWLQSGRIDVGFLSAAQIDSCGNLNSTVIGDYDRPRVRLPGAGGAPEIASAARQVIVTLRHSARAFVPKVDFCTSTGTRVSVVITDLGVLKREPSSRELYLVALHPGVDLDQVREQTGWDLKVSDHLTVSEPPSAEELGVLRLLLERTAAAHAV